MKNLLSLLVLILTVTSPAFAQIDLDSGLVAYYPFNDNANDGSGSGFDAVIVDNPELVDGCDGRAEGAYLFNGISDYIEVASTPVLNLTPSTGFSISVWVMVPEFQAGEFGTVSDIISKWSSASLNASYPYTIRMNNQADEIPGTIVVGAYDGSCRVASGIVSSTTVNDEKWHNIIFLKSTDDSLSLFIDGQLEGTIADLTTCTTDNQENLLIGTRSLSGTPASTRPFTGAIDEVRLYDRPLTEAEITALSDKTTTPTAEITFADDIILYPNPITNGIFWLKGITEEGITAIQLYDTNGRFIQQVRDGTPLDVPTGMYVLRFMLGNQREFTRKVLVE